MKRVSLSLCLLAMGSLCATLFCMLDELLKKDNSSIVLCVSPLTSLMIDQREKFTAIGLTAEFVGGPQCS